MGITTAIKRTLSRHMPLERYLRTVSSGYFAIYRLGLSPLLGVYEYPRKLRYMVGRGDTVIDIGANLGYYSWFFSRLAGAQGRVYAVEPVKPIFEVLRRNLRNRRNVTLMNYALGADDRPVTLCNQSQADDAFATGRNFVAENPENPANAGGYEFDAQMKRGSELFSGLERLDMIKCDIEGYEGVVIPEIEPLIDRFLPLVLIESGGDNRRRITEMFAAKGYDSYVIDRGRPRKAGQDDGQDLIFIHPSRADKYRKFIALCG